MSFQLLIFSIQVALVPSITSLSYIVMIPHRLISEHMMESEGENGVSQN